MASITYTPTGALQITIPPAECACGHAHPSSMAEWDGVIRAASKWLADRAPVCRGFNGVEPWARGDSPVTLLVARRPTLPEAGPVKGDKQTRSAFGCDACKKRKIKCDQGRPVCTNCCASSRKRARRCVYAYDIIVRPSETEDHGFDNLRADSTPDPSPSSGSIDTSDPAFRAPHLPQPPAVPSLYPDPPDSAQLRPQSVDAEALSMLVDTHGLTWFMNAAEIVEKQVLASNQRRAFTEYRHAVLERCWNAYINYNGKLPVELPTTSVDTPGQFTSAVNSMIALPGLDTLSSPSAEAIKPEQLVDLTQAALLHAFVAVGATHYAYWAGKRGEPSDEHARGAAALIQLSTNALLQVLRLQEAQAARHEEWEEEIDAKLLFAFSLAVTYRVCAVDPLGPATLKLECEWIARRGGPGAMISDAVLTPAQMELIPVVLNDAICKYALQRGEPSFLPPDAAWLDTIPVAHRLIPEGYGISLEMAKFLLETVAVLYGPCEGRADRLKSLHSTLSNALVDIYASAHPARVQAGDMLYRQALICLVCLDGLGLPADDPQLTSASDAILELFAEVVYGDIYTVRWALPLLVGGSLARKLTEEERGRGERDRRAEAGRIFDAMADTCGLADIEAARALTEQVWERRDKGLPWRWRDALRAMGVELFFV
ncbi:hypothetical protein CspeluHIS016_0113820 [Cutaneotrichosporon spelunceum]|uniref:Zn(2)-C6 fungal-type domain-containing protein n=1 Tax=Cutaneotrichosporon spelunceum TaxID=1672016 RepID=A0AAD3TQQ4_9TREE|nr:hypothetical protein CspeluHIS016_0113820 [Cutaneotrichosporon spelunceum]